MWTSRVDLNCAPSTSGAVCSPWPACAPLHQEDSSTIFLAVSMAPAVNTRGDRMAPPTRRHRTRCAVNRGSRRSRICWGRSPCGPGPAISPAA